MHTVLILLAIVPPTSHSQMTVSDLCVRFGKRTVEGILKDGWNALARYYLNNFRDGTRQVGVLSFCIFAEYFLLL